MIQRVYEQTLKSAYLSQVIVATDDQRIYDAVKSFGGKVVITSPEHQNGTERCAEVLTSLPTAPDVVINIQGDEPFIAPEQIDALAVLFREPECQIGTLVKACNDMTILERPSIVKAVLDAQRRALYFSRSVVPYLRNSNYSCTYYKHIGIYGFRAEVLREVVKLPPSPLEIAESLEQLRWLENGYSIHTALTSHESVSVDVPEDLDRVRQLALSGK